MLRPYFRNNKKVLSDIARLINDMILSYYSKITNKKIRTGIVLSFQSFGDFLRYNPHYHSLILEGGFVENGNFIYIPIRDLSEMKEYFRHLVIKYFKDTGLLSEKMARNLLSWKHSGFNINNSIRIMGNDNKAREALAQYIARCPISLNKIIYESFKGKVIFKTKYNAYFKENLKVFDAVEFIGQAVQHIPVPRIRLIRYFGLYSSKSRGKWQSLFCTSCAATAFGHRVQQKDWDHIARLAPLGWKEQNGIEKQEEDDNNNESCNEDNVSSNKNKASWARLIAYAKSPTNYPVFSKYTRLFFLFSILSSRGIISFERG